MPDNVAKILTEKEARAEGLTKDGLENLMANLGTGNDKRAVSTFTNKKRLSIDGMQDELNALYRTDWLAGKIVDIIPDDMTREWREFTGKIDPEIIKKLTDEEERLDLVSAFNEAHKWARLYGTAFIIMSIDDGGQPHEPLNMANVTEGSLKHIKVVDRHRMNHADVEPVANPLDPNYGFPEYYRIVNTSVKIHHSRVIRFDGVPLPFDEFRRNNYYSDSVLDRLYDALTNMATILNSSVSMVYETNVDIIKVKGLMTYLQSADGEAALHKRFTLAGTLKSFNNMMLLDSEEEWQSKTNTFAGLPDLIDRTTQVVTAGADVPATRLLGGSASGLNATGEGDLKNYYDKVKSEQSRKYRPKLNYFDAIMAKSLALDEGIDLSYEFVALFQMTPKEIAEIQFIDAQRDAIYYDRDIVSELAIAKELAQEKTYTNITDEDLAEMEAFLAADSDTD